MGGDGSNGRGGDGSRRNIPLSPCLPCLPCLSLSLSLSLCSVGERSVWGCTIWQKYRSTVRMLTLLACLRRGECSSFAQCFVTIPSQSKARKWLLLGIYPKGCTLRLPDNERNSIVKTPPPSTRTSPPYSPSSKPAAQSVL